MKNVPYIVLTGIVALASAIILAMHIFKRWRGPIDIRVIISQYIASVFLIIASSAIFIVMTFIVTERGYMSQPVAILIASMLVVILVTTSKKKLARLTALIFYKQIIDYELVLDRLSKIMARELDLKILTSKVISELKKSLALKGAKFFIFDKKSKQFMRVEKNSSRAAISQSSPLLSYILQRKKILTCDSMIKEIDRTGEDSSKDLRMALKECESQKISAAVPIFFGADILALLFLEKSKPRSAMNVQEMRILEILSLQFGSAVEKARLFEEVTVFNLELQGRVEAAVKELRMKNNELSDRNEYLTVLNKIGSSISACLNFSEVSQMAVNSIANGFGYIGGALIVKDASMQNLIVEAFSETSLTSRVIGLFPKNPKEYCVPLSIESKIGEVVRTGKKVIDNELAAFLHPPLPLALAKTIQHLAKIKTTIGIPIKSEYGTVGCLLFFSGETEDKISQAEFDVMDSLAAQLGVLYHNLSLYRALKEANSELDEANVHLTSLDETKSEFLSIAAHQLRTPLSGIKGYLSMMGEGDFGKFTAEQKGVVEDLLSNTNRLLRLVNIFLDVSRIEANRLKIEKEWFDVRDLVDAIYAEVKGGVKGKKVRFLFHKPKQEVRVFGDRDKLHDAIVNVVDNSLRYTDEGKVEIHIFEDDECVSISVRDTGVGIDESDLPNLFAKFVRGREVTRLNTAGAGLGLYIAKKIFEAHGGDIFAHSEGADKGTEFTLKLFKENFRALAEGEVNMQKEVVLGSLRT